MQTNKTLQDPHANSEEKLTVPDPNADTDTDEFSSHNFIFGNIS